MTGFLFALLASVLAGVGARDQLLVAGLVSRQGRRPLVLLIALASAGVTAALAAAASVAIAAAMPGPSRLLLAALAAGMAAAEMVFARAPRQPAEPTASLGAFAILILAQQLTDAVRFIVLGMAVATRAPWAAGLGGAVGSAVVVAAGWAVGGELFALPLVPARRLIGAGLLLPALWTAAHATGRI